jgi:hypothetical protein
MSGKNTKTTSKEVAKIASQILRDKRFSESAKTVAASALSQKTGNPSKGKKS